MSFAGFRARAARGGLVPVWRDCLFDTDTPVSAFAKLRRDPFAFLLESAPAGGETWSRYTFMGTEPRGAWRLRDGTVEDWTPARGWHGARRPNDPLGDLQTLIARHQPVAVPELGAFWSGAVGYFGYDVVRFLEHLPAPPPRGQDLPDALFVFTGVVVIIDNLRAQARVVTAVPVEAGTPEPGLRALYDGAVAELEATILRLAGPATLERLELDPDAPPATGHSTYERARFLDDVQRIREYILAGDCFQALLARRIAVPHDFRSDSLYRALRALNPSPYMYHLVLDGVELVGSSPELLVRVSDGRVTVRPIAGTRPRGRTPEEDEDMATELLADEKERAEHIMLVDLGRNDVGRIALYGTVQVTELMAVERYSHVLHIVSQVEGTLPEDASALEAFRATFPAGTMTGAPKVRAMEIIDELEPERRGPYAGAVGYIAAGDRRMDLAITIRTCVIAGGVASVQTGAGIVADSVPEREWDETENKARAMLTAIGRVRARPATTPAPPSPPRSAALPGTY
ncbi:MAG TPA: chorismate-binding protein [Gemmatimonadaceae bacterium]|nr:chorismate-binding protein [Gemmatimonadaceae bacterium]